MAVRQITPVACVCFSVEVCLYHMDRWDDRKTGLMVASSAMRWIFVPPVNGGLRILSSSVRDFHERAACIYGYFLALFMRFRKFFV